MCGACTVQVDGKAARSCSMPVSAAVGRRITTIENVTSTRAGKAVQTAWEKLDVVQCGYCQSGQIMSAAALLAEKPQPIRCRHRRGDDRQRVPLRDLRAYPRGDQGSREVRNMSARNGDITHDAGRREFLRTGAAFTLAFYLPQARGQSVPARPWERSHHRPSSRPTPSFESASTAP
jgi:aerobic-type carbon monoxide dehydrogenase small subunit (CoxS/CutS family)